MLQSHTAFNRWPYGKIVKLLFLSWQDYFIWHDLLYKWSFDGLLRLPFMSTWSHSCFEKEFVDSRPLFLFHVLYFILFHIYLVSFAFLLLISRMGILYWTLVLFTFCIFSLFQICFVYTLCTFNLSHGYSTMNFYERDFCSVETVKLVAMIFVYKKLVFLANNFGILYWYPQLKLLYHMTQSNMCLCKLYAV